MTNSRQQPAPVRILENMITTYEISSHDINRDDAFNHVANSNPLFKQTAFSVAQEIAYRQEFAKAWELVRKHDINKINLNGFNLFLNFINTLAKCDAKYQQIILDDIKQGTSEANAKHLEKLIHHQINQPLSIQPPKHIKICNDVAAKRLLKEEDLPMIIHLSPQGLDHLTVSIKVDEKIEHYSIQLEKSQFYHVGNKEDRRQEITDNNIVAYIQKITNTEPVLENSEQINQLKQVQKQPVDPKVLKEFEQLVIRLNSGSLGTATNNPKKQKVLRELDNLLLTLRNKLTKSEITLPEAKKEIKEKIKEVAIISKEEHEKQFIHNPFGSRKQREAEKIHKELSGEKINYKPGKKHGACN